MNTENTDDIDRMSVFLQVIGNVDLGVGAEDIITIYPVYLLRCFSGASTLNRPLLLLFKYFPRVRGSEGQAGRGGRKGTSRRTSELMHRAIRMYVC